MTTEERRVRTAAQICAKADELLERSMDGGLELSELWKTVGMVEALQWVRYFEGEEL
jgi:hypothetical protein